MALFTLIASDVANSGTGTSIGSGVVLTGCSAGQLVVLLVTTSGTVTITDGTAGSDALTIETPSAGNSADDCHIAWAVLTSGGDKTISANFSGSTTWSASALAFSGNSASPSDAVNTNIGTSSTNATVSLTTTVANALIVAVCSHTVVNITAVSPLTTVAMTNANFFDEGGYNLDGGAAGARAVEFLSTSNGSWGIIAKSFKPAAAGGPPPVLMGVA